MDVTDDLPADHPERVDAAPLGSFLQRDWLAISHHVRRPRHNMSERFDIDVGYRDPMDYPDPEPNHPPVPSEYRDDYLCGWCTRPLSAEELQDGETVCEWCVEEVENRA